jgi:hypothetical protein
MKRSFGCNGPGLHGRGKETGTQNISTNVLLGGKIKIRFIN